MDTEEAARLALRFAPAVYRLAYARMGNRADAEDVMQETFLRLVEARPELRDDDHAKAWLLRVAAQRSTDCFRARKRRREEPLDGAVELPSRSEERGEALEAVLSLPAQLRVVVHLYYYEGLTVAQVARVVGIGESAVKTRLFRARARLQEYLTRGGEVNVP